MEAPPPQPPLSTIATPKAPDSVDSSPVSRQTGSWDGDPPFPSKLRLMCSYGGHIVPRPHDKTLCYIGGDTRMIAIDRNSISLSDLHHRISKTLLQNQPIILKYQLPNEDLDSLISVATDEDLENMVDEYDRLNGNGSHGRGRLRIFLFPADCSGSMEQLLVETSSTKSEDWFLNALNGKMNSAGFSESSSVNNLLGLDDGNIGKVAVGKDVESLKHGGNGVNHDVHSMPGSPMLDTTSSFGSTSSSPSLVSANLPPIRVHVEENSKVGVEEQFQQMVVVNNADPPVKQRQEETAGGFVAPPVGTVVPGVPVGGDYAARVYSDDDRSDHGGYRMVPQVLPQVQFQQQQVPQFQQKQVGLTDLPSPDSASSEGSLTNPLSRQRQIVYQEPVTQLQPRVITNQVDLKTGDTISGSKVQMQQVVQESGYMLSGQYDQTHPQFRQAQQYIHGGTQYIPTGSIPMPSYYHVYPSQQQQQHPHPQMHDQQYPVYLVPTRQTQPYNLPVHSPTYGELASNASSTRPQTPHHAVYNQGRTATPIVQFPSSHHQTQYAPYPSQSMASSLASSSTYEYADHAHAQQIYYNQQLAPQYQTLTSAPVMVPVDASAQVAAEKARMTQA